MKRPDLLKNAFHKAARQAFDTGRELAWSACARNQWNHARALARCERVVRQAQRERWITLTGARALLGVVLDTQTLARWAVGGCPAPDYWPQVDALRRAIERTWRRGRRTFLTRTFP